ncbi:MAG: DUF4340 domain-containing protein [Methylococcaceae bacterium]|jgi:hypothetical protein
MKFRLILNLALLAIIATLLALIYFEPGKTPPETTRLAAVDVDAVTRITLQNSDTLVFEKTAGQWRLTAPFPAPVNQVRVHQLLEIATVASDARYPLQPADLAKFELEKPAATLTMGATVLQFGGTDPINLRRYVKVGDTLHLVSDDFYHHLTAAATDYVDKKLLPDEAIVTEIAIPGFKASRGVDGTWTEQPPAGGKPVAAELAGYWSTARAIDVKRLQQAVEGEVIRIGLKDAAPVEFVIVQRQPEWVLGRRDLGLSFEVPAETARQLLNQSPKQAPAAASTGEAHPDAAADHDHEEADNLGEDDGDGEIESPSVAPQGNDISHDDE